MLKAQFLFWCKNLDALPNKVPITHIREQIKKIVATKVIWKCRIWDKTCQKLIIA